MKNIKSFEEQLNEGKTVYRPKDLQYAGSDYSDIDGLIESFTKALKKLGINVYSDPAVEGSDTYQFYLTKEKLSKKQLNNISDEDSGLKDDED